MNQQSMRGARALMAVMFAFFLSAAPPLAGQCADGDCGNDGVGPGISITPDGETYAVDEGQTLEVAFSAMLVDRDSVDTSTISVTLSNGAWTETVEGWTWAPRLEGVSGQVSGTIRLSRAGTNVLTVRAKDYFLNEGSRTATFRVEFTDPEVPIVDNDVHHGEFRDLAQSQLSLAYTTPAYVSMNTPQAVTLQYLSELASPTAYVQVDAKPDPRTAGNVVAMSFQVIDAQTNAVVGREYFWTKHTGGEKQRMAVSWSMRGRPTGAYQYWGVVRSHFANGSAKEKRVPLRVLIVNETASRYGAGWTIGGLQRIYGSPLSDGVIVAEGNGLAWWFARIACSTTHCTFTTPEGDFSELVYDRTAASWARTYQDGSKVTFDSRGLAAAMTDSFGIGPVLQWQDSPGPSPVPVLASITDPMQKVTTFQYSTDGYLRGIADPARRRTFVTVNAVGDLISISGEADLQVVYSNTHLATGYTNETGTWNVGYYRGHVSGLTAPSIATDGGKTARPTVKYLRAEWKTTLLATEGTGLTNLAPAVTSSDVVEETVDAGGHKTSVAVNRFGQPTTVTDLGGNVTRHTWTRAGLLEKTVLPDGSKTEHSWNSNGQLISSRVNGTTTSYEATYTRPDRPDFEVSQGAARWYSWGSRGELLRSWYGSESDWERNSTTYEYDDLFRVKLIVAPKGERTEWTYGDWGNVVTVKNTLANGTESTTSFTYDGAGRQHTVTDPRGFTTTTVHDAANRVRQVTDALGRVTKFDYTAGLLTQVTDPAGKVYRAAYNLLGWPETETFPDGTTRKYTYNADGLTISRTDRRNQVMRLTYDAAHRPLSRTADGAQTLFSYPDRYTVVSSNAEGEYTTVTHPVLGTVEKMRTTMVAFPGRVYEMKDVLDLQNPITSIGTDINLFKDGVLQQTIPLRSVADISDDSFTITDGRGKNTVLRYDSSSRTSKVLFPNGVSQNDSFSSDGRLSRTWFSPSTLHQTLGIDYRQGIMGQITTRAAASGRTEWNYIYNAAGHLETATHRAKLPPPIGCSNCAPTWTTLFSATYEYDDTGNRTDSGAAVIPFTNRYSAFGGYGLEYDAEGNLTRKYKAGFEQRLTWNTLGQLTSVTTNGATITYGYDPAGRRVRRTAGGSSRYFLYDLADLLVEVGADGAPVRSYVYQPGTDRPVSVREHVPSDVTYYYVLEHPGHVRALLDQSGAVIGEYAYSPFGEPVSTSKGDGTAQPLRFMARELDADTRLYYVRNRWYDPQLARFISEDPIGLSGGINQYAYANSDPINRVDPTGLMSEDPTLCKLFPYLDGCPGGASLLLPGIGGQENPWTGWGSHVSQHGPPDPRIDPRTGFYDFGRTLYSQCYSLYGPGYSYGGDKDIMRGLCQDYLDQWLAEEQARSEAYWARRRECYERANAGSTLGQDIWHEAKLGIAVTVTFAAGGAILGSIFAAPGPGTAAGAAAGARLGAMIGARRGARAGLTLTAGQIAYGAVFNASVNRAGERQKQCGSMF